MNIKSKIGYGLLAALMSAVAFSATAGTLDRVKKSGKINIGYVADARPFSYKDESGNAAGYAVDICKNIAEGAKADLKLPNLSVNFVPIERAEGLRSVAQGKVDLLCDPVPPTLSSRKEVSYSVPIFASGVGVLVRQDGSTRLKAILSGRDPQTRPSWRANADQVLQRSTFSVVEGTRTEKIAAERLSELKLSVKMLPVKDIDAGIANVLEGRADAFFGDRATLLDAVKRHSKPADLQVLDRYFTHEVGSFALPRGDEDFRLFVDRSLSGIYRSAEFKDLYAKWFGAPGDNALTFFRLSALPE